jgi:hypothetical protein
MFSYKYQSYILRSLLISKQKVNSIYYCPSIKSVSVQLAPIFLEKQRILGATALLLSLCGYSPRQLFKISQRFKEKKLSGSLITLRGIKAVNFLSKLKTFSFFYSSNFKGFKQPLPNKSVSFCPKHLSFFLGARRAFDTGLLGFEDNGLFCHVVITLSNQDDSNIISRSLRLPIYT